MKPHELRGRIQSFLLTEQESLQLQLTLSLISRCLKVRISSLTLEILLRQILTKRFVNVRFLTMTLPPPSWEVDLNISHWRKPEYNLRRMMMTTYPSVMLHSGGQ